jgi:hypothetical protein
MKTKKQTERERVNQAVKDYLKRGGVIHKIEPEHIHNADVRCYSRNVRNDWSGGWNGCTPRCYQPRGLAQDELDFLKSLLPEQ